MVQSHHQYRRCQGIGQQACDQLGGLAQAHVVGEAVSQLQLTQEHQPAQSALLLRPQLADERLRGGQGCGPLLQITRQQGSQRAAVLHPGQFQLRW